MKNYSIPLKQLDKLEYDIEGILNDFENGITTKEESIAFIIIYIGERAKCAVDNAGIIYKTPIRECPNCHKDKLIEADGYCNCCGAKQE